MVNIANSLGMPTIFIRFNPDTYRFAAICAASKKATPKQRHEQLLRLLLEEIVRDPHAIQPIEVIYLYYDGCDINGIHRDVIQKREFTSKEETPSLTQISDIASIAMTSTHPAQSSVETCQAAAAEPLPQEGNSECVESEEEDFDEQSDLSSDDSECESPICNEAPQA
ncbi:MAG: hypothetical protein M0R33_17030 [Methylomonas sp.]|jgi:hypothetical protein|uniref:hypothetical protein n=1 Tax=Methylomonas sp. TaxID=418 RepID=UPI0025ED10B5|nr:hypothetical protein [Methylomonas sp.]MCK9608150.1 hypothetical protein [Methylomonas sp.]